MKMASNRYTGATLFLVLSAQKFLLWLFLQFPLLAEISVLFHNFVTEIYAGVFQIKFFVHLTNAEGF